MDLLCVRNGVVVQLDSKPGTVRVLKYAKDDGTYEYEERDATVEDYYHADSGWMLDPGGVEIGQTYDGAKFGPAPPPPAAPARTVFTAREFIQTLFTEDERKAVFTARRADWQVDEFVTLASAGEVDVTAPEVAAGLAYLVDAKLLTRDRLRQITSGAVPGAAGDDK